MRLGATALLVLGCALLFAGASPAERGRVADGAARSGRLDLAQARALDEFPLYDAGDSVDGLPLVVVLRRDDTADFVSFVYGDCVARADEGCAPPIEIQVWPACKRNLGLYKAAAAGTPVPEPATVRGVPGGFFEDGHRLELQTGRTTVVVFAGSRARVLRVAAALRPLGEQSNGGPLPQPLPGAVVGTLGC
jgi:hypothetical protein